MNILHIAYSLGESSAATRLAEAQAKENINIYFLLGRRSKDTFVRERQVYPYTIFIFASMMRVVEKILFKLSGVDGSEVFSFGLVSSPQNYFLKKIIKKYKINLIHLHWGGVGYFPLKSIQGIQQKFLITTHDYHYFTGGCHIPMDCDQYVNDCINCPLINSNLIKGLVHKNRVINKKLANLEEIKVIAPSAYAKEIIEEMQDKKAILIPNTYGCLYSSEMHDINLMIEKYISCISNNTEVKTLLAIGVNKSKRENKGQDILQKVIDVLCDKGHKIKLITVGESYTYNNKLIKHINIKNASTIALKELYAVSDLCLVPSRYETFSQVTLESLLCCTPVVAFDLTGPKDILGEAYPFLAKSFEIENYINIVVNNLEFKKNNLNLLRDIAFKAMLKYAPSQVTSLTSKI